MDQPIPSHPPVFTQAPVGPEPPKKSSKWLILVVGFTFLLTASGWLFYQNLKLHQQISQLQTTASPTPLVSPKPSTQAETADWKTYTNKEYGFEFKYPQTWLKGEYNPQKDSITIALDPQKVASQEDAIYLDLPLGLITVEHYLYDDCTTVPGYSSQPEVKIGIDQLIVARYFEKINGDNFPNGVYANSHMLIYCLQDKQTTISYVSHLPEDNLNIFSQILSTFKFTD